MKLLNGLKVVVSNDLPESPRIKLSENVYVSSKFRAEFNMWLSHYFGEKTDAIRMGDVLVVSPECYQKIKEVKSHE